MLQILAQSIFIHIFIFLVALDVLGESVGRIRIACTWVFDNVTSVQRITGLEVLESIFDAFKTLS